jgi:GTP cyclohydrolase I
MCESGVVCGLWTVIGRCQTSVTGVSTVKVREIVDVVTDHVTFTVAADQMLGTPDGWTHARDAQGTVLAWTHARKSCRERLTITPGYEFGYLIGATCSDGTVGKNYVSLVVNDRGFAERYARCLTASTGLGARLEPVTRPSGYLQRPAPGYRVRVVSSYLADLMRQYVGGDAHHMRQRFPRVVLRDRETFDGFLEGYVDGDGCRIASWPARVIVSANVPFLAELARVVGARFTPKVGVASHLIIADSWYATSAYAGLRAASRSPSTATDSTPTPAFWSTVTWPVSRGDTQAAGAVPAPLFSSSSGSLQTRSRKRAAAMTAMPARTEKPA